MKKYILLIIFFIVYITLTAQETEFEKQTVSVQISYETPVIAGRPWNLTLIIDYPDSEEVTSAMPTFNFLTLERVSKSPRLIEDSIKTVIDYRFIPNRTGRFTLESFAIIYPFGTAITKPIVINVQSENESQAPLILQSAWGGEELGQGIPSRVETGERAVVFLRSSAVDSQRFPNGFFTPETPEGIILSSLQLTDYEIQTGILAKFDIIPLEGDIYLPSRSLQFGNAVYHIPALRITVIKSSIENIIEISNEEVPAAAYNTEDLFYSRITNENNKQRIIRLFYFYFIFSLVIITVFVCLYLLLRKNRHEKI